jgi:hypothetical protein
MPSQSRGGKMEAGDQSISLDLLIRSLITRGVSDRELSKIIAAPRLRSIADRSMGKARE